MGTRTPLGLWLKLTEADRDAWRAAYPDFYLDASDLSDGGYDAADTRDRAEDVDRMGMTEGDYDAWQHPRQTSGGSKL